MDGWIQIHGWLASRPAGFFKKKGCQPCMWIYPSILGIYYWYWYIIGCIFRIMGVFSLSWGVFSLLWEVFYQTSLSLTLPEARVSVFHKDWFIILASAEVCPFALDSSSGETHKLCLR